MPKRDGAKRSETFGVGCKDAFGWPFTWLRRRGTAAWIPRAICFAALLGALGWIPACGSSCDPSQNAFSVSWNPRLQDSTSLTVVVNIGTLTVTATCPGGDDSMPKVVSWLAHLKSYSCTFQA
jgi:hypothetical protein